MGWLLLVYVFWQDQPVLSKTTYHTSLDTCMVAMEEEERRLLNVQHDYDKYLLVCKERDAE